MNNVSRRTKPVAILMASMLVLMLSVSAMADTNWTGATSTDWSDASNWDNGLPGSGNGNVIINPGGAQGDPIVSNTGNTTDADLYISTGAGLTIPAGGELTVGAQIVTGQWGASLPVVVSGGTLNIVGWILLGNAGFEGDLNIASGTVNAVNISINNTNGAAVDMTGGQLIFSGVNVGNMEYWITSRDLGAYAKTGTINVDDTTTPGSHILTPVEALPPEPITADFDTPLALIAPTLDGVIGVDEYPGTPLAVNAAFFAAGNGRFGTDIFGGWPGGGVTDDADYSYNVYTTWTATALHVAIEVTDDEVAPGGNWASDFFQVIIDPIGDGTDLFHFNAWLNDPVSAEVSATTSVNGANISNIEIAAALTAEGYVMEFSFAWADMTPVVYPIAGTTIGLLFAGYDDDLLSDELVMTGAYEDETNPFAVPGATSPVTLTDRDSASGTDDILASTGAGFIEEGSTLTLTAPSGSDYQWELNGAPLADDAPRLTGTNSQKLVFAPVLESDEGVYTCTYDDGISKAIITTPAYDLQVLPPGSVPVSGLLGLGLLTMMTAVGGAATLRRKK